MTDAMRQGIDAFVEGTSPLLFVHGDDAVKEALYKLAVARKTYVYDILTDDVWRFAADVE